MVTWGEGYTALHGPQVVGAPEENRIYVICKQKGGLFERREETISHLEKSSWDEFEQEQSLMAYMHENAIMKQITNLRNNFKRFVF